MSGPVAYDVRMEEIAAHCRDLVARELGVEALKERARALRAERARSGLPGMGLGDLMESMVGDALDRASVREAA